MWSSNNRNVYDEQLKERNKVKKNKEQGRNKTKKPNE